MIMIDKTKPRAYTNALWDMVEQGLIDKDYLIRDLIGWMSEHDVRRFCQQNSYLVEDEDE